MNKYRLIVLFVLSLFLVFGLLIWGFPIQKSYSVGSCTSTYDEYLLPLYLCQKVTGGHCVTTEISKQNAINSVGRCLCNDYLAGINNDLSVTKICRSSSSCSRNIQEIDANEICNDIESNFSQVVID